MWINAQTMRVAPSPSATRCSVWNGNESSMCARWMPGVDEIANPPTHKQTHSPPTQDKRFSIPAIHRLNRIKRHPTNRKPHQWIGRWIIDRPDKTRHWRLQENSRSPLVHFIFSQDPTPTGGPVKWWRCIPMLRSHTSTDAATMIEGARATQATQIV